MPPYHRILHTSCNSAMIIQGVPGKNPSIPKVPKENPLSMKYPSFPAVKLKLEMARCVILRMSLVGGGGGVGWGGGGDIFLGLPFRRPNKLYFRNSLRLACSCSQSSDKWPP